MVTVEISARLTVDDLVSAVEKLPPRELIEFIRRTLAIQAQRGVPLLVDEEEQALWETIDSRLNIDSQSRLDGLREKSRQDTLTTAEQAELLRFVQQVEKQDLARVEALVKLAQKRRISISALMNELGLEPIHA